MDLEDVIEYLEDLPADRIVRHGLSNPHSYRGWYEQVAFELKDNVTIGAMLASARAAVGATFTGYKGGSYTMRESSLVNIANEGETGGALSEGWLEYLCRDEVPCPIPPGYEIKKLSNAIPPTAPPNFRSVVIPPNHIVVPVIPTARSKFQEHMGELFDRLESWVSPASGDHTIVMEIELEDGTGEKVVMLRRKFGGVSAKRSEVSNDE